MALQGNITIYWNEQSPTETNIVKIKYPEADKMDPEDPNYEKAGTEEEIAEPLIIEKSKEYENVYVVIRTYALMKSEVPIPLLDEDGEIVDHVLEKDWYLNLRYTVYESEEAKNNNPEEYILENYSHHLLSDENLDLTNLGYDKIKTLKGFEQLIDVI
jgi:hypothetical protein